LRRFLAVGRRQSCRINHDGYRAAYLSVWRH
jgi:hypothetical protein